MNEAAVKALLEEVEKDERLYYKSATISINAPLALIQLSLETRVNALREVLEMPILNFEKIRKEKKR